MHINYEYLLNFLEKYHHQDHPPRSLDYGCGSGEVVEEGRKRGLNVYGVDIFYQGGNRKQDVVNRGFLGDIVREIKDNCINFPDEYFDIVVNNMVFEHVENLHLILKEIHRVLKPNGILLSLFPSKECWREGHCGIPFLHRFPKGSQVRFYYAWFLRFLGMGKYKKNHSSTVKWAKHWCEYIDNYTYYRSFREIIETYTYYFGNNKFIEEDYILFRLEHNGGLLSKIRFLIDYPIFKLISKIVFRKLGCVVIRSKKMNYIP